LRATPSGRDRGFADSPVEGDGFEPSVPLVETGKIMSNGRLENRCLSYAGPRV
jgi:hypothetical protein